MEAWLDSIERAGKAYTNAVRASRWAASATRKRDPSLKYADWAKEPKQLVDEGMNVLPGIVESRAPEAYQRVFQEIRGAEWRRDLEKQRRMRKPQDGRQAYSAHDEQGSSQGDGSSRGRGSGLGRPGGKRGANGGCGGRGEGMLELRNGAIKLHGCCKSWFGPKH
ncbi:hypothetical protein OIO90_004656 [Microbotryomycetes sp. JL221]|nr:hypothetical protein OIO90_004656 [Microbotryomycetes sp. JL221]